MCSECTDGYSLDITKVSCYLSLKFCKEENRNADDPQCDVCVDGAVKNETNVCEMGSVENCKYYFLNPLRTFLCYLYQSL